MPRHNFTVQTRQKSDLLVQTGETLDPADTFESEVREVAGYSAVSILVKGTQSIRVRVEEACKEDGAFGLTETFSSALDPGSGLYVVCERFAPCGAFAKFYIDNLDVAVPSGIDACIFGLPVSASPGIPGPAGPAGPAGPSLDTRAATFVVAADHADYPLTEAGLNAAVAALPASGGSISVGEGTLAIVAGIVGTDKPIEFIGRGQEVTILDIGANVIAAFSTAFTRRYSFRDLSIKAGNVAGQKGFVGSSATFDIEDCAIGGAAAGERIDFAFESLATITVDLNNVEINLRSNVASRIVSGTSVFRGRNVRQIGKGGFTLVDIHLEQSSLNIQNVFFANPCVLIDCEIAGASMDIAGNAPRVIGCKFTNMELVFSAVTGDAEGCIIGCTFIGSGPAATSIDLLAASAGIVISGNRFDVGGATAVTIKNTGNVVGDNFGCLVNESGAADSNVYGNNEGFYPNSTIIGPLSLVDGQQTRQTTTTPYTVVVTDRTLLIDATAGNKTVNLPAASVSKWRILTIKKVDASANTVTIDGNGGDTIDGAATLVIAVQYASFTIQSDGATWWVL